jgi:hypothetical protein
VNILLTGGSHVVALNQGFKRLAQSGEIPSSLAFRVRPLGGGLSFAREFFRPCDDHVEITHRKFRARFTRIPPPGVTYDAIVLSTALYSRPVWDKADWAVYGVPGFTEDRILTSNSMLRRAIYDDNRHIIAFLGHLRAFGMKVCMVEGPRPFRHNIEVQRTGVDLVKHIDTLYRSLTLALLEREAIPVILVPDSAFDENGFMLEKYRHKNPKDKTHGNADFGQLMMRRIVHFIQQLDTAPTVSR